LGPIFAKLDRNFSIKKVSQKNVENLLKKNSSFCFGICSRNKFYFLTLKDKKILDKMDNKLYSKIDSYVFHKLVLPELDLSGKIEYTHSLKEAAQLTARSKAAFLLRPASLDSVIAISSKGFRLPQKSTYFYPKLLSGLVLRRFRKE